MTKRTLGSVVKEARDGARMTQRDLAAAIGVKSSHIAYIENGYRKPSISLINRLSETLGLDAITKDELKILKQVATLERVAHPGQFIFILNFVSELNAAGNNVIY